MNVKWGLWISHPSAHTPLFHLLLHVDALFLQQLSLSEGPVDGLHWCLSAWRPLSLQASLLRVIEAKHVAFSHDDAISWLKKTQNIKLKTVCLFVWWYYMKWKKLTLGNKVTFSNRNSLSCLTLGLILCQTLDLILSCSEDWLCFPPFSSHLPDRRTVGEVTLFPLTYVSAPSHGSRMTHPKKQRLFKI